MGQQKGDGGEGWAEYMRRHGLASRKVAKRLGREECIRIQFRTPFCRVAYVVTEVASGD